MFAPLQLSFRTPEHVDPVERSPQGKRLSWLIRWWPPRLSVQKDSASDSHRQNLLHAQTWTRWRGLHRVKQVRRSPCWGRSAGSTSSGAGKDNCKGRYLFQIETLFNRINRMAAEILSPDAESFWANKCGRGGRAATGSTNRGVDLVGAAPLVPRVLHTCT